MLQQTGCASQVDVLPVLDVPLVSLAILVAAALALTLAVAAVSVESAARRLAVARLTEQQAANLGLSPGRGQSLIV